MKMTTNEEEIRRLVDDEWLEIFELQEEGDE